jgi:hypothetical protein
MVSGGIGLGSTAAGQVPTDAAQRLARDFGLVIRPPAENGVRIRVIDAATRKPLPGVLVAAVDELEFTYRDEDGWGRKLDGASLLKSIGTACVTNAEGTTSVATSTTTQLVFAWHGAGFGRSTVEPWDRVEHVVEVGPRDLAVEVVDASGHPQSGVPIVLAKCVLSPDDGGVVAGITGHDGRCSIAALDLEHGVHATCGYRDLVMLGCLAKGAATRSTRAARLDPVRFVLPACGRLDVELQTRSGKALTKAALRGARLVVNVEGDRLGDSCGLERDVEILRSTQHVEVEYSGTPLHFDHVELGLDLDFSLVLYASEGLRSVLPVEHVLGDGETDSISGPARAGERVRRVLRTELEAESETTETANDGAEPTAPAASATTDDSKSAVDANDWSTIEVSVRTDSPPLPCTLRACLDEITDRNEHYRSPWIDVDSHATMRAVSAGTHSVTISLSSFDEDRPEHVLARIEGIEVPPRQHLRDPRLLGIDLRGKLRVRHLEVVDEAMNPLDGRVEFSATADAPAETEEFEDGVCDLVTATNDERPQFVAVDRFRPFVLDPKFEGGRVVMRRGIPIRVVLDPRWKPTDGSSLYLGVPELPRGGGAADEDAEDEWVRTFEVTPGSSACFSIPEPGEWRVILLRSRETEDGDVEYDRVGALEPTIQVVDGTTEQLFHVAPADLLRQLDKEQHEPSAPPRHE